MYVNYSSSVTTWRQTIEDNRFCANMKFLYDKQQVLCVKRQYCNFFNKITIHEPALFILLGVRSLANASRAKQFNPLNPPGVGWVPLPQTNMAAVVGRAWSYVAASSNKYGSRGRSCVVVPFCPLRGQHCRGTNEQHLITH